jgi:hypothetical protein
VGRGTRRASVDAAELERVIEAAPDLVELDLHLRRDADRELVRTCAGLPRLRVLGTTDRWLYTFHDAPVTERISTLRIRHGGTFDDHKFTTGCLDRLASSAGALRTIELELEHPSSATRHGPLGWFVRFDRDDAPGPFTRMRMWWLAPRPRSPKQLASDFGEVLCIAPNGMRELEIDVGRAMRFPPELVRRHIEGLRRHEQLERVTVPFAFTPPSGAIWHGDLACHQTFARTDDVWNSFATDLGIHFDSYSTDDRGTPALGKVPKQTLEAQAHKAKHALALRQIGTSNHVTLRDDGTIHWSTITPRSDAELVAWFVRTVTALDASYAALRAGTHYAPADFSLEGQAEAKAGWVVALRMQVDADELAAVLAEFPDMRQLDAPAHLVLQIGAAPADATKPRTRAVAAGLVAALDRSAMTSAPAWFEPLAVRLLAPHAERYLTPIAERLRRPLEATTTLLRVYWGVRASHHHVVARLLPLERGWRLYVAQSYHPLVDKIVDSEADAAALLAAVATGSHSLPDA